MSKQFGLTSTQKYLWVALMVLLLLAFSLFGGALTGPLGRWTFLPFGLILGFVAWFVSAAWSFKLELTDSQIIIKDPRQSFTVPLDRIGMLVRNGGFPFPTLWLVLRADTGNDIPARGVDPQTRSLIEAYHKRHPGKKLSFVPIPGGYLTSIGKFREELKQRIPPLVVDDRLKGK